MTRTADVGGQGHGPRPGGERGEAARDQQLLANANIREPADLAAVLRAHPSQQAELLGLAHSRFGNGFVSEALAVVGLPDQQARSAAPGALPGQATLRGVQGGPDEMIDDAGENRAYNAASVLPFGGPKGWNATAILTNLGQRDTMSQTDSDGHRCVQAAGVASHVLRGPEATIGYLQHMLGDAAHGATAPTPRQTSARAILGRVCDRIRDHVATFQDLSWAQEALHDLTVADSAGTAQDKAVSEIAPTATSTTRAMHQWCKTPHDVIAAASALHDGEQLVVMSWVINFNSAFFEYETKHPDEGTQDQINVASAEHPVWRQRQQIRPGHRPDPTQSDPRRDLWAGHQLLIVREGPELRLYDPENQRGGHYRALDDAALAPMFVDEPAIDAYRYMRIDARITPR